MKHLKYFVMEICFQVVFYTHTLIANCTDVSDFLCFGGFLLRGFFFCHVMCLRLSLVLSSLHIHLNLMWNVCVGAVGRESAHAVLHLLFRIERVLYLW